METLNRIQRELKAPKGQKNTFGNYNYRSCEDILEAVKPLLGTAILTLSDEMVMLGDRFYVRAVAVLSEGNKNISTTAYARESLDKKGMDSAQITGAASSYARKYALNGLFLIDDTKDADHTNKGEDTAKADKLPKKAVSAPNEPTSSDPTEYKLMVSKYDGVCKKCEGHIAKGDDIAYSKEKGVFHPDCI